jgi:hypothetical protein
MTGHGLVAQGMLCLLGMGLFLAGLIGVVKQGMWKQ